MGIIPKIIFDLKLKKEGVRVTKQKKLVLDIIENSHKHPTAEEVFFEARQQMPNIALGTVYRNLNSLVDEGFVRRITLSGTPDRFDKKKCDHDHLVCQKCGKLKDVFLNGIADEIKINSGNEIISYELNAYYICDSCK